jgi:hypothetical protein
LDIATSLSLNKLFGFRKYPGIILLFFPFGTKLILGFLAMLTKPVADHPQEHAR